MTSNSKLFTLTVAILVSAAFVAVAAFADTHYLGADSGCVFSDIHREACAEKLSNSKNSETGKLMTLANE